MSWGFQWRAYVPVAKRQANAKKFAVNLAKKEKRELAPIVLVGRRIAGSFWGKAWCDHLERYSDYDNRLPRGRTYVRNGSVIDLQIERGKVKAIVSGSEIYRVSIAITTVPGGVWSQIKKDCSRSVDSLIDLLQGKFDQGVMERLSQRDGGLFPQPKEIKMSCSCPDGARMCKHVAATLYGVGARLDAEPELLFTLRDVDHLELVGQAVDAANLDQALKGKNENALDSGDLGEIFGIDIEGNNDDAIDTVGVPTKKSGRGKTKGTKAKVSASSKTAKKLVNGKKKVVAKKKAAPTRKRKAAAHA